MPLTVVREAKGKNMGLGLLNPAAAYDQHTVLIDLFIYTLIFVGVAQATLGRRFADSGGRVVSLGTGTSLAVAMTLAEAGFGFSLKSFGPVAVTILLVLFAAVAYRLFHFAGLARPISGALAYLALLLVVNAVSPELFSRLPKFWQGFLVIISMLATLLLLAGLSQSFGRNHSVQLPSKPCLGDQETRGKIDSEVRYIRYREGPLSKGLYETSQKILGQLQVLSDSIRGDALNEVTRAEALDRLRAALSDLEA